MKIQNFNRMLEQQVQPISDIKELRERWYTKLELQKMQEERKPRKNGREGSAAQGKPSYNLTRVKYEEEKA